MESGRTIAIVTYPIYGKNLHMSKGRADADMSFRQSLSHSPPHFPNDMFSLDPLHAVVEHHIVCVVVVSFREEQLRRVSTHQPVPWM